MPRLGVNEQHLDIKKIRKLGENLVLIFSTFSAKHLSSAICCSVSV